MPCRRPQNSNPANAAARAVTFSLPIWRKLNMKGAALNEIGKATSISAAAREIGQAVPQEKRYADKNKPAVMTDNRVPLIAISG